MVLIKVIIATLIFALIQLAVMSRTNLLAAVVANIPIFTVFAFLSVNNGQDLRKMALYLFIMTLSISLGYFTVYVLNISVKQTAIAAFGIVWIILTITAYLLLRKFL